MSKQEIAFQVLRLIDQQPNITQRELSEELDVSLGKAHYVLKALVQTGWVKFSNFQRSNDKKGYAYLLTPSGMAEKVKLTKGRQVIRAVMDTKGPSGSTGDIDYFKFEKTSK